MFSNYVLLIHVDIKNLPYNLTREMEEYIVCPMNTINLTKDLADSVDSAVYCNLIDQGIDPGRAWELTFGLDFDLVSDVEADPAINDGLV